jgi:hypothetical protein
MARPGRASAWDGFYGDPDGVAKLVLSFVLLKT